MFAVCAVAQTRTVSGTVRDAAGNPMPGVAVTVPGSTTGTVTDIDGRYTLKVDGDVTSLSASFIGMKSATINLAAGQTDAEMVEDNTEMDEVLVVAYGTTTKQAFTGSAAVVEAEDIQKRTTTNVANQLSGQVPGLQMRGVDGAPGSSGGGLKIRGVASLYAAVNPLVIVDGAPYPGNLSEIPTSEIESVTVLKDAASAALYGARGASGVILITTKKGSSSDGTINVEAKIGVNSRSVKDYDVITDPGEYYEAAYAQYYNKYFYGDGLSAGAANVKANRMMLNELGYQSMSVPEADYVADGGYNVPLLVGMDGKINPNATLGFQYTSTDGKTYWVQPDDYTDAAYDNATRQEYTVSAAGGNEKGNYFASVGYLDDQGIIEYTSYKRFSARLKTDYQIKKWFRWGANVGFTSSKTFANANMDYSSEPQLSEANLMYFVSSIAPIYPLYSRVVNADGSISINKDELGNDLYDFNRGEFGTPVSNGNCYTMKRGFLDGNPLGNNRYNEMVTRKNNLNATMNATINFMKNLKLDAQSTIILNHTDYTDYENKFFGSKKSVGGYMLKRQKLETRQNHVQTLSYFDTFNDVHNLNVMIGHEYYLSKSRTLAATAEGSFSQDIKELAAFATKTDNTSTTGTYNVEGWFGNVQYNFDEKYYVQGSYRRDASSRFAKDNRWGDFWSVGTAWIVSKENFMAATQNVLDELKVKFSIGQQGNDNIGDYAYIDEYTLSKSSETSMSPTFDRMGNPDITWETVTNTNIGVEFSLFKHRLVGAVDYYNKKTTDLLFWLSIPESAGSRGYYGNIGDIRNRGIEVQLTGTILRTKDINWTISGNLSHNKSKILTLPESKTKDYGGFYEDSMWYTEGGELYNYMLYSYAGVDPTTGKALYWYDEDLSPLGGQTTSNIISKAASKKSGKTDDINKASRYANGSNMPKIFGGFGTNFTWKGLDASVSFDYQIGGKVLDLRYKALMSPAETSRDAGQNYHKDWVRSWSPDNVNSDIPRWQYGDKYTAYTSDRFMTDASYLNFSSFVVGYTLPKQASQKILMNKIRVYVAGENLGFWSARDGFDPRFSYGETTQVSNYSPARTISGGIQLQF